MAKFIPSHGQILVRRVEDHGNADDSTFIPESKEKPFKGEVLEVSKAEVDEKGRPQPLELKKGDRVLFGKYSGMEIKVDGADVLIMREEDVLRILTGERSPITDIDVNDPGQGNPKHRGRY